MTFLASISRIAARFLGGVCQISINIKMMGRIETSALRTMVSFMMTDSVVTEQQAASLRKFGFRLRRDPATQ